MPEKKYAASSIPQNAIFCVDYTNVFGVISQRSDNDQPDVVVLDVIKELKRHVGDKWKLNPIRTLAFSSLPPNHVKGHRATGAWLSVGIEPRFTYASVFDEASAIDLALETVEMCREYGPGTAFVILSGNRWFVPLVQRLQRKGHFVLMAALECPTQSDHLPEDCRDAFLHADFLLGGPGRKLSSTAQSSNGGDSELDLKKPLQTFPITDDVVRRTLEIIDSYFGQYEEIYLTPLLRKLSEEFQDSGEDPKALINDLEESGAVWLQKRRGFPHNYTVLMMNDDHSDVAELKEARLQAPEDSYDDDFYDDYADADDDSVEYLEEDDAEYQK
ncbi:MAG: NYN domain-containing protein [Bacteroidetes bacterium]|nr:NYN domain-containing protein [Bacteroidota bacterium]